MKKTCWLLITGELFWWMLFLLVGVLSIIPVAGTIHQDFLIVNGIMAVIFSACFRYVIFFNKVVYFKPVAIKVLLLFANIYFFFWLINHTQDFLGLFDHHDISFFMQENTDVFGDKLLVKLGFFKKGFLFFSVGILILLVFLELRLMGGILDRVKKIE